MIEQCPSCKKKSIMKKSTGLCPRCSKNSTPAVIEPIVSAVATTHAPVPTRSRKVKKRMPMVLGGRVVR